MGPIKVLIADDDESIVWVLEKLLREKGLETISAKDGTEAAEALIGSIQLALLDINMPGKNGLRLLTEAKDAGSPASFIMMTAEFCLLMDGFHGKLPDPRMERLLLYW